MMKEILETLEGAGNLAGGWIKRYLVIAGIILSGTLILPFVFRTLGVYMNASWLIMFGGILYIIGVIILFVLSLVIIIPADAFFGNNLLGKFIARVKGLCYMALLVTLFLLLFLDKIRGHMSLFPILIIVFLMLYAGSNFLNRKIVNPILFVIFLAVIFNLLAPGYADHFLRKFSDADNEKVMERVQPTLAEIDSGKKFSFVDKRTGEVIVWYVYNPNTKKIELYKSPGTHSSLLIPAEPVTRKIIEAYRMQQEALEGRILEEKTKAEKKNRYHLAISMTDLKGNPIDCKPLIERLRERGISAVVELTGVSSIDESAKYVLKGKVEASLDPNSITGKNSSYISTANISYSLYDGNSNKIGGSSVNESAPSSSSGRAKNSATRIALASLGDKIYPQIK